jgi:hypothetical protein
VVAKSRPKADAIDDSDVDSARVLAERRIAARERNALVRKYRHSLIEASAILEKLTGRPANPVIGHLYEAAKGPPRLNRVPVEHPATVALAKAFWKIETNEDAEEAFENESVRDVTARILVENGHSAYAAVSAAFELKGDDVADSSHRARVRRAVKRWADEQLALIQDELGECWEQLGRMQRELAEADDPWNRGEPYWLDFEDWEMRKLEDEIQELHDMEVHFAEIAGVSLPMRPLS